MSARSLTVSMRAYVLPTPRAPSVVVRDRSTRTRRVRAGAYHRRSSLPRLRQRCTVGSHRVLSNQPGTRWQPLDRLSTLPTAQPWPLQVRIVRIGFGSVSTESGRLVNATTFSAFGSHALAQALRSWRRAVRSDRCGDRLVRLRCPPGGRAPSRRRRGGRSRPHPPRS